MDQDHQRRGTIIAIIESGLSEDDWNEFRNGKGLWPDDHRRDWQRFRNHSMSQLLDLIFPPATKLVVDNSSLVAAIDECKSAMTSLLDELTSVMGPFVKLKTKIGSKLGKTEMELFTCTTLSRKELPGYVERFPPKSAACEYVFGKVLSYTKEMMQIYKGVPDFNEDKHIRPPTFALTRDLVNHFLSDYEIQFFEKGTGGALEIGYRITLDTPNGLLPITGDTDQLIECNGSPIGLNEIKNLAESCITHNDLCQVLAVNKGFSEKFKKVNNFEARVFPTSLVSGKRWVFLDRCYADGSEQYLFYPMLETFDVVATEQGTECRVNEENVLMVSRMLVRMIFAMKKLINDAAKKRKARFDFLQPQDDADGSSDASGQSGGDEDDEPVHGPASALPASGAPTGRITRSVSKSAGASNEKQKTSWADTKRQRLTSADTKKQNTTRAETKRQKLTGAGQKRQKTTQSALTVVNLRRHDWKTLRQRAVLCTW